jgi:hypothetical protein
MSKTSKSNDQSCTLASKVPVGRLVKYYNEKLVKYHESQLLFIGDVINKDNAKLADSLGAQNGKRILSFIEDNYLNDKMAALRELDQQASIYITFVDNIVNGSAKLIQIIESESLIFQNMTN